MNSFDGLGWDTLVDTNNSSVGNSAKCNKKTYSNRDLPAKKFPFQSTGNHNPMFGDLGSSYYFFSVLFLNRTTHIQ